MRIYLDVCCLSRPLDDQSVDRVRLESGAVLTVLELCAKGEHRWVSSMAVEQEVCRNPDEYKRSVVAGLLQFADEKLDMDDLAVSAARRFVSAGIAAMDAAHLAIAEAGGCDVFLSTDDALLRRARLLNPPLRLRVANPANWIVEVTEA